jgi:hypothetical protein
MMPSESRNSIAVWKRTPGKAPLSVSSWSSRTAASSTTGHVLAQAPCRVDAWTDHRPPPLFPSYAGGWRTALLVAWRAILRAERRGDGECASSPIALDETVRRVKYRTTMWLKEFV